MQLNYLNINSSTYTKYFSVRKNLQVTRLGLVMHKKNFKAASWQKMKRDAKNQNYSDSGFV